MIKVGVIGLGTVAQLMHLPVLNNLFQKYEITAVSDVSPSLVEFISKKYCAKPYESPFDLINDKNVEAVFVLSPDQYHSVYVRAAILANKHVFVEKPATLCPQQLEELIQHEKDHPEIICMVGYMRRYANGFMKCKELLKNDDRKIEYMRFRDIILEGDYYIHQTKQPFVPADIPADLIAESKKRRMEQIELALGKEASQQARTTYAMLTGLGCHTLSAVRELVGNPASIESVTVDGEHVVIVFRFADFLAVYEIVNDQDIVQFDAAIEIYQRSRHMMIKYETPYIRYQPQQFELTESTQTDTRTIVFGPDYHDPFENELIAFADCIQQMKKPKTTLSDSLEDLKLFKKIVEKIESQPEQVSFTNKRGIS